MAWGCWWCPKCKEEANWVTKKWTHEICGFPVKWMEPGVPTTEGCERIAYKRGLEEAAKLVENMGDCASCDLAAEIRFLKDLCVNCKHMTIVHEESGCIVDGCECHREG